MSSHKAKKRFGQNFLHDDNVIHQIVLAINPQESDNIIEIGPGLGALTSNILPLCSQFEAIELDRDLIDHLQKTMPELTLHEGDALEFDFTELEPKPIRLIGNLPYNISSPLIFHCLDHTDMIQDMHFMLQKEVAERIAAEPGSKDYGRLSIMTQIRCTPTLCFDVDKSAFNPIPAVTSSIIRLVPHDDIQINDMPHFDKLVKQAFSQRRKTLRKSLKGLIDDIQFAKAEIDPSLRPEQLSVQQFVDLSNKASV